MIDFFLNIINEVFLAAECSDLLSKLYLVEHFAELNTYAIF